MRAKLLNSIVYNGRKWDKDVRKVNFNQIVWKMGPNAVT